MAAACGGCEREGEGKGGMMRGYIIPVERAAALIDKVSIDALLVRY